jgi:hypothetical protein
VNFLWFSYPPDEAFPYKYGIEYERMKISGGSLIHFYGTRVGIWSRLVPVLIQLIYSGRGGYLFAGDAF